MARVEKQQFVNNTQGWVGATVIGPRGDEIGIAVEAGQAVWLSEEEQVLTANAPRDAADNPFLEQEFSVVNADGQRETVRLTPLTPTSEDRFVPANARPIPSDLAAARSGDIAQAAATGEQPDLPTTLEAGALERHAEVSALGPDAKPHDVPVTPRARAAAAALQHAGEDDAEPPQPVEPPQPPPTPAVPVPPGANPDLVTPPDEGRVGEEHAARSPGVQSEETGAAVPPTTTPATGGFKSGEEVGSPEAPAAAPPPYSPESGG